MKGVRTINEKKLADKILNDCYNEYRIKLFNYCLARLGTREAADDCVQEAFIVFYNKLLDGEKFENPRAFLYRTADNFVKRQKQKTASEQRRTVPLEEAESFGITDDEYIARLDLIDYEECAKVLIRLLTDEEKQLYELRYIRKTGVEEIAEKLGISRPAASMRLMRLRNKIKDMVYSLDTDNERRLMKQ